MPVPYIQKKRAFDSEGQKLTLSLQSTPNQPEEQHLFGELNVSCQSAVVKGILIFSHDIITYLTNYTQITQMNSADMITIY